MITFSDKLNHSNFSYIGRACNDKRFEIIVGKCINPQVPGAIPNWFGAPAFRLLEKTQQLFPAPFCSGKGRASKSRPKYSNTCRCAEGQDAFEITTDGTVRGNCTGYVFISVNNL